MEGTSRKVRAVVLAIAITLVIAITSILGGIVVTVLGIALSISKAVTVNPIGFVVVAVGISIALARNPQRLRRLEKVVEDKAVRTIAKRNGVA